MREVDSEAALGDAMMRVTVACELRAHFLLDELRFACHSMRQAPRLSPLPKRSAVASASKTAARVTGRLGTTVVSVSRFGASVHSMLSELEGLLEQERSRLPQEASSTSHPTRDECLPQNRPGSVKVPILR